MLDTILFVLALLCFLAATAGVKAGNVALVPLGLACLVLTALV